MSDFGLAIVQLGSLVTGLVDIYIWVVIVAALLSFVNPDPYNSIVQFLHKVTQPAYRELRKYVKTDFGGLDLAPLALIIGLQVISILITLLVSVIARSL